MHQRFELAGTASVINLFFVHGVMGRGSLSSYLMRPRDLLSLWNHAALYTSKQYIRLKP